MGTLCPLRGYMVCRLPGAVHCSAVGQDIRFLYYLSIHAGGASGRGRCLSTLPNYSLGVLEPLLLHMVLYLSVFSPPLEALSGLIFAACRWAGDESILCRAPGLPRPKERVGTPASAQGPYLNICPPYLVSSHSLRGEGPHMVTLRE